MHTGTSGIPGLSYGKSGDAFLGFPSVSCAGERYFCIPF